MKIVIKRDDQSPEVIIDLKGVNYAYSIKRALKLALSIDGFVDDIINEIFNDVPVECKTDNVS